MLTLLEQRSVLEPDHDPRDDDRPVPVGSLAFWPRAGVLIADSFHELLLWDVDRPALVARHPTPTICRDGEMYFRIAIDDDERWLVTAAGIREMAIWELDQLRPVRRLAGHGEEARGAVFVGERLISASGDSTIRAWDVSTGAWRGTIETSPMYAIAADPARTLVAAGGSCCGKGRIYLVEPSTLTVVRVIDTPIEPGPMPAMSPGVAHAVGVAAKRDRALIDCLAWHPGGRLLVTGGWDFAVKLFDTTTGEQVRRWLGHEHWVTAVACSPDGEHVISGGTDGRICVWSIDHERLLADLCPVRREISDLCVVGDRIYAASTTGFLSVLRYTP